MTNLLAMSLAYKAAALQLIVGEANFFARQLDLPGQKPIVVTKSFVRPPGLGGFGGVVETTNLYFSFSKEGKLWTLGRKDSPHKRFDGLFWSEFKHVLSKIDNKSAHQLATQWLAKVDVDVAELNGRCNTRVWQQKFFDPPIPMTKERPPPNAPMSTLPIFFVAWIDKGNTNYEVVKLTIDGTKKELVELTLEDTSFSKRPPLVITNTAELMGQPPPLFKKLEPTPPEI